MTFCVSYQSVNMRSIPLQLVLISCIYAFNIFIYNPLSGHSHVKFMSTLADILTDRGHNVTVVMPIMDPSLLDKNGLTKTKNIIYLEPHPQIVELITSQIEFFSSLWTVKPDAFSMLKMFSMINTIATLNCQQILNNQTLLEYLSRQTYDIGMAEPFTFCGFGLMEVIKVPTTLAALSASDLSAVSRAIGEPSAPSYYPGMTITSGDKMNFFERVGNSVDSLVTEHIFASLLSSEHKLFMEKYGTFRRWQDILSDINYMFTNSNPYLNYPHPTIHKVVEIGGITVGQTSVEVDDKWDSILNERKQTVLVSFGSVAKSKDMPQRYKDNLLQVFSSMSNITFIWKYELESSMADHLPNVHLAKWLPQVSLLNDDRLSLFVTHGGLGSVTEVSLLGKPAVLVPLFAEQPRNAAMLSRHGGSLLLKKEDLDNPQLVQQTIHKALNDETLVEKAKKLAEMLKNPPVDVTEKFVKHVEFAARFGRVDNLTPHGRNLSYIEYFLVDVIVFVLFIVVVVLLLSMLFIRFLLRRCLNREKTKKD